MSLVRSVRPGARLLNACFGFTLLEVMVALSILALALTALAGINANSFNSSNYAKQLTVATLLARSKMIDVEEELRKDGFGEDDKEFDGDFDEEGYPGFRWVATARKIEVDVAQLIGGLFGGDVDAKSLPDEMQAFIGAMNGQGDAQLVERVGGSELSKMLGGEAMEGIFKQIGETLGNSIREISLEITWGKPGVNEDSVRFVQYVTTTGRLTLAAPNLNLPGGVLPGQRNTNTAVPPKLPGGLPNPAFGPKTTPLPQPKGFK